MNSDGDHRAHRRHRSTRHGVLRKTRTVTVIGILGAGQAGSTLAQAFIAAGYSIMLSNSRSPHTVTSITDALGPRARPAWAADTAALSDLAVLAFPYAPADRLPSDELSGKVVLDNNNYMPWRDGYIDSLGSGDRTVHELRQEQLPGSLLAKAFSHIQFHARPQIRVPSDALPALTRLARPNGDPERKALAVFSDFTEATSQVTRLYDALGFDAVDGGPLRESWRSEPGTPLWQASFDGQTRDELIRNLQLASRRAV